VVSDYAAAGLKYAQGTPLGVEPRAVMSEPAASIFAALAFALPGEHPNITASSATVFHSSPAGRP
jgi:hypothetical protein